MHSLKACSISKENSSSENISKAIGSLAIIKIGLDEGKDYIDNFLPFIATLIHENEYKRIDVHELCRDFEKTFGINVPYHPMKAILSRAKRKGLIKKDLRQDYIREENKILAMEFSDKSRNTLSQITRFVNVFIEFAKKQYNIELAQPEAESSIITFLKEHSIELFNKNGSLVLPDVEVTQKERFLLYKFIRYIFKEDVDLFKFLVGIATGYQLANVLVFDQTEKTEKIDNLSCYLDTRFILRLLGLEGSERESAYLELSKSLLEQGVTLLVFRHTLDEINGILRDCEKWIQRVDYDPLKAGAALKYFVSNNFKFSDIRQLMIDLNEKIESLNMEIVDAPIIEEYKDYAVDDEKLHQCIVNVYKEYNDKYEEVARDFSIQKDVKSIAAVVSMRKGKRPRKLCDVNSVFITTNCSLAVASKRFESGDSIATNYIPSCITDTVFGTLLWLQSPAKIRDINEKKIIADCTAALQPNEILIKKFINQVDKLKREEKISQKDAIVLRTYDIAYKLLEDKTMGDHEAFFDNTTEEILEEIKFELKLKAEGKYLEEKRKHDETLNQLSQTEKDKEFYTEKSKKQADRVEEVATRVASIMAMVICGAIFIIVIICDINLINDAPANIISLIITILVGLVALLTGFIKKLKEKMQSFIGKNIKKYITSDNESLEE
nr:hypothetical protein [uncultured Anaeromusa sp.]